MYIYIKFGLTYLITEISSETVLSTSTTVGKESSSDKENQNENARKQEKCTAPVKFIIRSAYYKLTSSYMLIYILYTLGNR